MLSILFLTTLTGSAGCRNENLILQNNNNNNNYTNNKMLFIVIILVLSYVWTTDRTDMESVQGNWSITVWIKQIR